ncbi:hypothetical protein, conserved [Eimeria praecox]|uniref:Uncharacterized protein n=1 Tax=Eimeria praecox TaxID=51316 RepID=U6G2R2_9EIME|nr:hypothetical protein, conserved [Eimeria praecox]
MAKNRRRSLYTDRSLRNQGDQPLSPPTDTSSITTPQPQNTPQAPAPIPYIQMAKNMAFSFSDDARSSSQISNDPYELAVTWNYHEGRQAKAPSPSTQQSQEADAATQSEVGVHSSTTLQVEESNGTQSQPECPPAQSRQETPSFTNRQMIWVILSVITTLGYLLVLTERMGLAHPSLLQSVGSFSLLFSGLPGICLACMCYVGTICASSRKAYNEGSSSVSAHESTPTSLEPLVEPRMGKKFDVFEALHELRTKSASSVLKTLFGFVLWDLVKAYTSFWPLLHLPSSTTHRLPQEPPFFGQSPEGAKPGIHGYPPRIAPVHSLSLPLSPLCQLVFPLFADGSRLVGLWLALKTMRQIQRRGKPETANARQWLAGGSQVFFLALFALPLSFVLLHQSFWGSSCMQPFTGMMPLVGEQATAFAGLLLRCHSGFLGLAAALTGSILASAFHGLLRTNTKSLSAIWAAMASLAFCSCILFDVLAAAVPSAGISCTYTPFIADMRSGFVAVKAFAMAATLSHQVGQICLSLSAVTIKLGDVVESAVDPQDGKEAGASSVPTK